MKFYPAFRMLRPIKIKLMQEVSTVMYRVIVSFVQIGTVSFT
jgi:hypothetical protein